MNIIPLLFIIFAFRRANSSDQICTFCFVLDDLHDDQNNFAIFQVVHGIVTWYIFVISFIVILFIFSMPVLLIKDLADKKVSVKKGKLFCLSNLFNFELPYFVRLGLWLILRVVSEKINIKKMLLFFVDFSYQLF